MELVTNKERERERWRYEGDVGGWRKRKGE